MNGEHHGKDERARVAAALFCLGALCVMAQVTFTRELLVAFYGNELCISGILASWLFDIALGALLARALLPRMRTRQARQAVLLGLLLAQGLALPAQAHAARVIRPLLGVAAGEYASIGQVLLASFLLFLPTCLCTGAFFPIACAQWPEGEGRRGSAAAVAYAAESLGSLAGGAALTFFLLGSLDPFGIVLVAMAAALAGGAFLCPWRGLAWALVVAACAAGASGGARARWVGAVEERGTRARWQAFGVLQESGASGGPAMRLAGSRNTPYQNLALVESAGQYALYGNGQVLFVFPDPVGVEHAVHFIMAQKPGARRVLLIGGDAAGIVPELLKYSVQGVVCVDLDAGIGEVVRAAIPEAYARAMGDRRVVSVVADPLAFVRDCRERFDAVILQAPEPTTAGANRFHTAEFFAGVHRLLAQDGFFYTSIASSERLQSEAARLGASVCRALTSVFPVVLATAGSRTQFFAGAESSGLTFDRQTLFERSQAANPRARFFRPEYLLGLDDVDPEKTALVRERFAAADVPANTLARPVTCFYNLMLWSQYSASGLGRWLAAFSGARAAHLAPGVLAAGLACLLIGLVVGRRKRERDSRSLWVRLMLLAVVGTTAFCGMALEFVLILVYQGAHGSVYTRLGLIVAAFMAGLVLGAAAGRALSRGGAAAAWIGLGALELLMMIVCVLAPQLAGWASPAAGQSAFAQWVEPLIYLCVAGAGFLVGAEFPVANRLLCEAGGGSAGAAAGATDAADHAGAAVGSLVTGVALVPLLGLAETGHVLAALKAAAVGCLLSAAAAAPRPRSGQ